MRKTLILCASILFISYIHLHAQWDNSCTSASNISVRVDTKTNRAVCAGSQVDLYNSGFSGVGPNFVSATYTATLRNNTTQQMTIFTTTFTKCNCPTAANYDNGSTPTPITIPANLPEGQYSLVVVIVTYAGSGTLISRAPGTTCTTRSFQVIGPPSVLNIQASPTAICVGQSATIMSNFASCTGTVVWSNGQQGGSINVSPNSTTTYTAVCQTDCGTSSASKGVTVQVTATPNNPILTSANVCRGQTATLNASNCNGTVRWATGQTDNSITFYPQFSSGFSATCSVNGCVSGSASTTVQVSDPSVNIGGGLEFCQGGNTTLNANVGGTNGNIVFEWRNNGQNVGTSNNVGVYGSGNYSVKITDAFGCSATSPEVSVRENPKPNVALYSASATGTETIQIKAEVSSGTPNYNFSWSANPSININGQGSINPIFGPFTQNTGVFLNVTDSKGCKGGSSINITYSSCKFSVKISPAATFFCRGTINISSALTDGNGGYSYQWKEQNDNIGNGQNNLDVSEGGIYTLIVKDAKGCVGISDAVKITKGNSSVSISGKNEFCTGSNTTITANPQNTSGTVSYQWKLNNANVGSNQNIFVATQGGTYGIDIIDGQGCTASTTFNVVALALPVANAGIGRAATCAETYSLSGITTATGGAGGYQYSWSAVPTANISNPTTAQPVIGPFKDNTTISLKITDSKGCVGTAKSTITYTPPDLSVIVSGPAEFCEGKNAALKVAIDKANLPLKQLVWYNNATQEITKNTNDYTTTQKGSFTVLVEDAKGCLKTSNILNVAQNPNPKVNITGPTFYCVGSSAMLTANVSSGTQPFKYQWQNTATLPDVGSSISVSTQGSYSVNITDSKGCLATSSPFSIIEKGVEIVANTNPTGNVSVYAPDKVLLTATLGKEYSYQWQKNKTNIAGAVNGVYEAAQSGVYTVVVTHGECSRTSEVINVQVEIPLATMPIQSDGFKVFPNPTTGLVQIQCSEIFETINLQLIDCQGKTLQKWLWHYNTTFDLDLSNYADGLYFLGVNSEKNNRVFKIVKVSN